MVRAAGYVMVAVLVGGVALAGCSSSKNPSGAVKSGASAAASAANGLSSAASSAASGVSSAAASAQAAASSAMAGIKGGQDAKNDVSLGKVTASSDGKVEVPVTVNNREAQSYRYIVQVNFTDQSGNVLDATVVKIPEVGAGANAQAVAHSNRKLSVPVAAVVNAALAY